MSDNQNSNEQAVGNLHASQALMERANAFVQALNKKQAGEDSDDVVESSSGENNSGINQALVSSTTDASQEDLFEQTSDQDPKGSIEKGDSSSGNDNSAIDQQRVSSPPDSSQEDLFEQTSDQAPKESIEASAGSANESKTGSTENHRPRSFLDLPGELRNIIYAMVLDINQDPALRLRLSILATCRQTHAEARLILHKVNPFITLPSIKAAIGFLKNLDEHKLSYLEGFRIMPGFLDRISSQARRQWVRLSDKCTKNNLTLSAFRLVTTSTPYGFPGYMDPQLIENPPMTRFYHLVVAIRVDPVQFTNPEPRGRLVPLLPYTKERVAATLTDITRDVDVGGCKTLEVVIKEKRSIGVTLEQWLWSEVYGQHELLSKGGNVNNWSMSLLRRGVPHDVVLVMP